MRVLDIDLDFFLAGCCPLADKGRRPELFGHEPWESGRVRRFLEGNCGLSKDRPIPGRIFETHDSALELWRDMLEAKRLTAPFDVTHIDAHSDLGIGYPGPGYVLNGVLPIRYDKRADAESTEGSTSWTRRIICFSLWPSGGYPLWKMCVIQAPYPIYQRKYSCRARQIQYS